MKTNIPLAVKVFGAITILIIAIASIATIYFIRQTNIQTDSQASEIKSKPEPITGKKDAQASESGDAKDPALNPKDSKTPEVPTEVSLPESGSKTLTNPNWVYQGTSYLSVLPIPNGLKNTLYIKFEAPNFKTISSISYLLTYNSGLTATVRSAQGTITPAGNTITRDSSTNLLAITRSIFLGTCSQNVCTPDTNTNSFKLVVSVTYSDRPTDGLTLETFSL